MAGRMSLRFILLVLLQILHSKLSSGFFFKFFPFKPKVAPEIPTTVAVQPEVILTIEPIEKNDLKLGVLLLNLGGPQSQKVFITDICYCSFASFPCSLLLIFLSFIVNHRMSRDFYIIYSRIRILFDFHLFYLFYNNPLLT